MNSTICFARVVSSILFGLLGVTSIPAFGQSIVWKPASTIPIIQLNGEYFQMYSHGVYFNAPTLGRTMTRAGVLGADLGFPVVFPDKIVFLFGDSMGTYKGSKSHPDRSYLADSGGTDAVGYIPNMDLSQCDYISEIEKKIEQGVPNPGASEGPPLSIYLRNHLPPPTGQAAFQPLTITGLDQSIGEGTGPYETPSGGFSYQGFLYMFYIPIAQFPTQQGKEKSSYFALESVMTKSVESVATWSDQDPPVFEKLYAIASHPKIDQPFNPPPNDDGPGKFMFNAPVLMTHQKLVELGLNSWLPSSLGNLADGEQVAFVFGSSWNYRNGNLYLAAFAAKDAAAGTAAWYYYKQQNQSATGSWDKNQNLATGFLSQEQNLGNHSVVWNDYLHQFVLLYQDSGTGKILTRFASAPWGPWSSSIEIFSSDGTWGERLIHHVGEDPIKFSVVPIYDAKGLLTFKDQSGVAYSPNLIDKSTLNMDGSVTLYFTISTWYPYEVFLIRTTFQLR